MVLGMDISTSVTGYTILDKDGKIIEFDHIDTKSKKKFPTLWSKVDYFKDVFFPSMKDRGIKFLSIEEPLSKFSRGKSSSHTISLLMRYNGIVSYIGYMSLGLDPIYYPPSFARKVCGLKLVSKKKAKGLNQKEQTFEQMRVTPPFKDFVWDKKRTGKLKDYCYDRMDAYVIARACFIDRCQNMKEE